MKKKSEIFQVLSIVCIPLKRISRRLCSYRRCSQRSFSSAWSGAWLSTSPWRTRFPARHRGSSSWVPLWSPWRNRWQCEGCSGNPTERVVVSRNRSQIFGQKWIVLIINENLYWFLDFQDVSLRCYCLCPFPAIQVKTDWRNNAIGHLFKINVLHSPYCFYILKHPPIDFCKQEKHIRASLKN